MKIIKAACLRRASSSHRLSRRLRLTVDMAHIWKRYPSCEALLMSRHDVKLLHLFRVRVIIHSNIKDDTKIINLHCRQ